jgi:hypothetical protein
MGRIPIHQLLDSSELAEAIQAACSAVLSARVGKMCRAYLGVRGTWECPK